MPEESAPHPPKHLPLALRKKWSDIYAEALKQAKMDIPDNENLQKAAARKEANKLLRVPRPETHKEAQALVDDFQAKREGAWKLLAHGKRTIDGADHLSIVTSDGQKYLYPVPVKGAAPAGPVGPGAPGAGKA